MPNILITGANRGIGFALAKRAVAEGWRVFATCRDPARGDELRRLPGSISVHPLDVADHVSIEALANTLRNEAIDVLINNAGVSDGPGQNFDAIDYDRWFETLRINTIGPVKTSHSFLPNIERGERKLIVCMTSEMGSIAGASGGYYGYRTSKAALNMAARNMAQDLRARGVAVVVFHPGWVRTDMGGLSAPLTAEDSVDHMWRAMMRMTPADSGTFFNYDGTVLPW